MASTFLWHNDPNSGFNSSQSVLVGTPGVPGEDSLTYINISAANTSSQPLPDVGLFIPFAWADVPKDPNNPTGPLDHRERMTWDNSRNGFVDSNYNNTGESVLLTPSIGPSYPNSHVAAGSVADLTDTHVFAPNSASVQTGIPASIFPPETNTPGDLLPFADLDSFTAGQSKQLTLTWTAHWDGPDHGAVRVGGYAATLAPDKPGSPPATSTTEAYNLFRFG